MTLVYLTNKFHSQTCYTYNTYFSLHVFCTFVQAGHLITLAFLINQTYNTQQYPTIYSKQSIYLFYIDKFLLIIKGQNTCLQYSPYFVIGCAIAICTVNKPWTLTCFMEQFNVWVLPVVGISIIFKLFSMCRNKHLDPTFVEIILIYRQYI